jgi:phage repressor protein C with HTH and peptisase S24 domain
LIDKIKTNLPMQNKISERFIACVKLLKERKNIPSIRQFAISIDLHPQCISDVMTGKRDVNTDMIAKCVEQFDFNPVFLFTGEGNMFSSESNSAITAHPNPILSVVTDNKGNERIVHVPVAAQAGYGHQLHDPIFLSELPSFTLPDDRFKQGSFRCFDISGDSMEPTLFSGDKIVCSFVDPDDYYTALRDNYVYVVITKSGVVVKRIKNTLKKDGHISLFSDNSYYDRYQIELDDISEIWLVTLKISHFMPSPRHIRNALHQEVDILKDTITDQSRMIKSLNSTVEKLLKQNRTSLLRS